MLMNRDESRPTEFKCCQHLWPMELLPRTALFIFFTKEGDSKSIGYRKLIYCFSWDLSLSDLGKAMASSQVKNELGIFFVN